MTHPPIFPFSDSSTLGEVLAYARDLNAGVLKITLNNSNDEPVLAFILVDDRAMAGRVVEQIEGIEAAFRDRGGDAA